MRAAEDQVVLTRQKAIGRQRQRQAGVRAAVDVTSDFAGSAHDETEEQFLTVAKHEASRARLGDVGEGAQARAGRRLRRVHGASPTVARQGRISARSNWPASL